MIVYLSGPMSGIDESNYPAFAAAAARLRDLGHLVLSPHELVSVSAHMTWQDYLRIDLATVLRCQVICLLPGWPASKGARLELTVALDLGLAVWYLAPSGVVEM